MANTAPALPTRFPCWCRATYSWGGETKRDLGFVEGDLIECLNAGDGSWWMGRLRRDKRAMGLFPSNFVQVLDDSFRPMNRVTSPMVFTNAGGMPKTTTPQKAKTFRKPYQAYAKAASPSPVVESAVEARTRGPSPSPNRQQSFPLQKSSIAPRSRAPSPAPQTHYSHRSQVSQPGYHPSYSLRASSPVPTPRYPHVPAHEYYSGVPISRIPSPAPSARYSPNPTYGYSTSHCSRAPSPALSIQYHRISTYNPSECQQENDSSPPPPAPPPHRVVYNSMAARRTPSPAPPMTDRYAPISRVQSPAPPSPMAPGFTPSPLRDAMEDVMSSLQDMALRRDAPSPCLEQDHQATDPWSPDAFSELQRRSYTLEHHRPLSSLGIASSQMTDDYQIDDKHDTQRTVNTHEHSGIYQGISNYPNITENGCFQDVEDDKQHVTDELFLPTSNMGPPPAPPKKNLSYQPRPSSSLGMTSVRTGSTDSSLRKLRNRKSAYELGREILGRTLTAKSNTTNSSSGVQSITSTSTSSTQRTSQSIMSGFSAGGFSATSAGSLARRKGLGSISRVRPMSVIDNQQDVTLSLGDSGTEREPQALLECSSDSLNNDSKLGPTVPVEVFGGLTAPKAKKSGFLKKLVETAKTGAASARSSIASGQIETPRSPIKNLLPTGATAMKNGNPSKDMGLGSGKSGVDWVQVRRDINRSNSLSRNERVERIERCQMMNYRVIAPISALFEFAEGDEGVDGLPIEKPTDFQSVNFQLVDKSARFVNSLPPMTNAAGLAQSYVCRPYRSDVQRLRAIFTWVSEKVAWEEDFEGQVDSRRVIQMKRGCAEEVAVLVMEMCMAMGIHAEIVRGFLKTPGEVMDKDCNPQPNHWWNAVIVDNGWRIIDCSLANHTNPKRAKLSSAGSQVAETGWFLARPMEICYTHIPMILEQQHICPPIAPEILLALPPTSPTYFRNGVQLIDYDTSLIQLENLELMHIKVAVPHDIECFAEVETKAYARDSDGDCFESGDTTTTRALAQAEWIGGQKRYSVKAFLPGDEGQGLLKVYCGKRGLMHSIKDNPHPLAFALPIFHTGSNPPYSFFVRHPTPHAQRHDLYVSQPQCVRLAVNNTFVFAVRQHPSSLTCASPTPDTPFTRPTSAMSMASATTSATDSLSQAGSSSTGSALQQQQHQFKPAKLAIQSPSGKILRLMRKSDNSISSIEAADGGVWETIIKVGERGTWRGLVLADRSARWCVFGEWECI